MHFSNLINQKNKYETPSDSIYKSLYKGACVKIKNSQKTYQVIGINQDSNVCWLREWPLNLKGGDTFSLELNEIILQTFCSNYFSEY